MGGRGQGRTSGTASGDRGVGDAEHQMGDGGRFVGGGGGVVARGDWRLALRGDATSAAELLGEGSGSALSATRNITVWAQAPLPGPPNGPCAACATAPTRVLGLEYGGRLPRVCPLCIGGCGPVLWPRYCVGAGTRSEKLFKVLR